MSRVQTVVEATVKVGLGSTTGEALEKEIFSSVQSGASATFHN